jgi:Fur family zinc uptake transcriptional regulator
VLFRSECEHDCIFLVCDVCGRVSHVDDDQLAATVRAAAARKGYSRIRPVIEVRGCCADCSEGDAA